MCTHTNHRSEYCSIWLNYKSKKWCYMKEQKEVDLNAELNQMIWAQKKELEFPPLEPVTKNKTHKRTNPCPRLIQSGGANWTLSLD